MEFMLPLAIQGPSQKINFRDKILLVGSCFTEHMGKYFSDLKFSVLQNPNGILFDALSVATSLRRYVEGPPFSAEDLFLFEECYYSWQHHGAFSDSKADRCLAAIQRMQDQARDFVRQSRWCLVTLGSAFSYRLKPSAPEFLQHGVGPEGAVANCHRVPAPWFSKKLLEIQEMTQAWHQTLDLLFALNPNLEVFFTISPVRHHRDGLVANNRSKARLLETVHSLSERYEKVHYFPAYEIVIDQLRDYRFFDLDMVHPNYQATQYVLQQFCAHYLDAASQGMMDELAPILAARRHRPLHPETQAHQRFLESHWLQTQAFSKKYADLDMSQELAFFGKARQ